MELSDALVIELVGEVKAARAEAAAAREAVERVERTLCLRATDHEQRLRSVEKRVGVLWAVSGGLWSLAVVAFGAILKKLGVL